VKDRALVICLANTTGALDFTDFACHCILQRILNLSNQVDIVNKVIEEELPRAQNLLGPIEQSNREIPDLSDSPGLGGFVGVWEHIRHHLKYKITSSGELVRIGETTSLGKMIVRVLEDGRTLRIFPGESVCWPDRRTNFTDIKLTRVEDSSGVYWEGSGQFSVYEKLPEDIYLAQ